MLVLERGLFKLEYADLIVEYFYSQIKLHGVLNNLVLVGLERDLRQSQDEDLVLGLDHLELVTKLFDDVLVLIFPQGSEQALDRLQDGFCGLQEYLKTSNVSVVDYLLDILLVAKCATALVGR